MSRRPNATTTHPVFPVRFHRDELNALRVVADSTGQSVAGLIKAAIREHVVNTTGTPLIDHHTGQEQ